MPRRRRSNEVARRLVLVILAGSVLAFQSCSRDSSSDTVDVSSGAGAERRSAGASMRRPVQPPLKVKQKRNVYAAWYEVPEDSLARRRAGQRELTAAHNKLPLGTLVRVTHLKNGRTALVRITDRGIKVRKIKIDVCKEAAEELDMIEEGIARVRIEVLEDQNTGALAGGSR